MRVKVGFKYSVGVLQRLSEEGVVLRQGKKILGALYMYGRHLATLGN